MCSRACPSRPTGATTPVFDDECLGRYRQVPSMKKSVVPRSLAATSDETRNRGNDTTLTMSADEKISYLGFDTESHACLFSALGLRSVCPPNATKIVQTTNHPPHPDQRRLDATSVPTPARPYFPPPAFRFSIPRTQRNTPLTPTNPPPLPLRRESARRCLCTTLVRPLFVLPAFRLLTRQNTRTPPLPPLPRPHF